MPADNTVTMEGWIVSRDAEHGKGAGPGRFRMSTYCSGSKDKDNVRKAFITVKQFDMDVASLVKGAKVRVEGRFDPWEDKEGKQVLDVMAESVEIIGGDNASARQPAQSRRRPAPDYNEEPF